MKASEAEQVVINELRPFFMAYDYSWIPHYQQFRRLTSNGFHNLLINIKGDKPQLVDIKLGCRIDMVEDLVYQFTTGLLGYQEHSNTFIASLGEIIGQSYFKYEISDKQEAVTVSEAIKGFMLSKGLDFIEQHSSVQSLDKLFNDQPTQKLPYATHPLNRCLRGIVLARLAERKDFIGLVAIYRRALVISKTAPPLLEKYDRLCHYLKSFSFN